MSYVGTPIHTIDDAEIQGWMGLAVRCCGCRQKQQVSFARIRRKTSKRHLIDIATHMICSACESRPEEVSLFRMIEIAADKKPEPLEYTLLRVPVLPSSFIENEVVRRRAMSVYDNDVLEGLDTMCNLYSMTSNVRAILDLARALNRAGNLPAMPAIFPDFAAPIVRSGKEGRELVLARWGMPTPLQHLGQRNADPGITNVRNAASPHWRQWLGTDHRCVVPFTSFSEFNKAAGGDIWFALSEERPLAWFAGVWTEWTGVRKVKEGAVQTELFAFLTTEPNKEVGAIHPKAMPVILTDPAEIDAWLHAPMKEALGLQRPLPDGSLHIVARGAKKDGEAA